MSPKNIEIDEVQEAVNKIYSLLTNFEKMVIKEYLATESFEDLHKTVNKNLGKRIRIQTIDDALLRIKYRARHHMDREDIEGLLDELSKT